MENLISELCEKYGYTECLKLLGKKEGNSVDDQRWVQSFYNYVQKIGRKRPAHKLSFNVSCF